MARACRLREVLRHGGRLDDGTARRRAGSVASFSSIPQTGKLKALMWTATPSAARRCAADEVPPCEIGSIGAVD